MVFQVMIDPSVDEEWPEQGSSGMKLWASDLVSSTRGKVEHPKRKGIRNEITKAQDGDEQGKRPGAHFGNLGLVDEVGGDRLHEFVRGRAKQLCGRYHWNWVTQSAVVGLGFALAALGDAGLATATMVLETGGVGLFE